MSPAGYWPQVRTAIEAGADSVYFGLHHFTARVKVGFDLAELPEVMQTLHRRGVKGFVTFNTLVFDHELKEAAKTLARIADQVWRRTSNRLVVEALVTSALWTPVSQYASRSGIISSRAARPRSPRAAASW